jgi:hypothetical protein
MNGVQELEEALTLDRAQGLVDFDSPTIERASSTQQLLDELLGRFEDDDSPVFRMSLMPEFPFDSDESDLSN